MLIVLLEQPPHAYPAAPFASVPCQLPTRDASSIRVRPHPGPILILPSQKAHACRRAVAYPRRALGRAGKGGWTSRRSTTTTPIFQPCSYSATNERGALRGSGPWLDLCSRNAVSDEHTVFLHASKQTVWWIWTWHAKSEWSTRPSKPSCLALTQQQQLAEPNSGMGMVTLNLNLQVIDRNSSAKSWNPTSSNEADKFSA
jgi:hypothetical protein